MGTLVPLAWPETIIRPQGCFYDKVFGALGLLHDGFYMTGHGGLLLLPDKTGKSHYFDFGRYHLMDRQGRMRGELTDPEVAVSTPTQVDAYGTVTNIEEILAEVAANPATHGTGKMVASLFTGIDFEAAYAQCRSWQDAGALDFAHFDPRGTNCSRMIARLARTGDPSLLARLIVTAAWFVSPSPLMLTRVINDQGFVYVVGHDGIAMEAPWFRFKNTLFPKPTEADKRGVKAFIAPERTKTMPPEAKWLKGVAFGTWFALSKEPGLAADEYRVRRYSPAGEQECDRVFSCDPQAGFDISKPYEFSYPSHCRSVVVAQNGKAIDLVFRREFTSGT